MKGALSTHVLDTARGRPAEGVEIELARMSGDSAVPLKTAVTNADGRTDEPLLAGAAFTPGSYRILFRVGDYYRRRGHPDAGKFLDAVPVVFSVDDPSAGCHVPLLVTPWSYSTYRGS
jgi:hydroxyisourate hydrolase